MKVRTRCGHCGKVYNMSAGHIGLTAQCKQCHHTFLMTPQPDGSPLSAPQQALPSPAAYPAEPHRQEAPQAPACAAQQSDQGAFALPQDLSVKADEGSMTADGLPNPFNAPSPPDPFTCQTYGGTGTQTSPGRQPSPQAAGQPAIDSLLQRVVCPQCHFTSGIRPVVGGKVTLRCQECGKIFSIKADPRFKKHKNMAKANGQSGGPGKTVSPALIILGSLVMVAAIFFVGPVFLPDIIPNLLPF